MKFQVPIPTEDAEQIKLFAWLDRNNILAFAIPNGGKRILKEAVKLRRTGTKSGVPDILLPMPRSSHHGLFLELKRIKGGKISDNQLWWLSRLKKNGYRAEIAYGADEAIEIVKQYLGMP